MLVRVKSAAAATYSNRLDNAAPKKLFAAIRSPFSPASTLPSLAFPRPLISYFICLSWTPVFCPAQKLALSGFWPNEAASVETRKLMQTLAETKKSLPVRRRRKLLVLALAVVCLLAAVVVVRRVRAGATLRSNISGGAGGQAVHIRRSRSREARDHRHFAFHRRPVHPLPERRTAREGRRLHQEHLRRYRRPRAHRDRCWRCWRFPNWWPRWTRPRPQCTTRKKRSSGRRATCLRAEADNVALHANAERLVNTDKVRPGLDRATGTGRRHRQGSRLAGTGGCGQVGAGRRQAAIGSRHAPISSTIPR